MLLGYNTNGLANHDATQAIKLVSEIGYQSLAITVDHHCLNPFSAAAKHQQKEMIAILEDRGLRNVIETGARFLLDPGQKHEPTLLSSNPGRRIDFYKYCIDLAAEMNSDCVSIWSGILREPLSDEAALERLAENLESVLRHAEEASVLIGFEPEPGMFIDTTSRFERLRQWVDSKNLKMTMDLGHLYCLHEIPIADYVRRYHGEIVNIHIEDMRAGVHEHLEFGQGEMSFPPIIQALSGIGYQGALHVELSRHSHDAPTVAKRAYEFLAPLIEECGTAGSEPR